jgi:hypothetical protein
MDVSLRLGLRKHQSTVSGQAAAWSLVGCGSEGVRVDMANVLKLIE